MRLSTMHKEITVKTLHILIVAVLVLCACSVTPPTPTTYTAHFSARVLLLGGRLIYIGSGKVEFETVASTDPTQPAYVVKQITLNEPRCFLEEKKCSSQLPESIEIRQETGIDFGCWQAAKQGADYTVPVVCQ